jgi:hypothetical protein
MILFWRKWHETDDTFLRKWHETDDTRLLQVPWDYRLIQKIIFFSKSFGISRHLIIRRMEPYTHQRCGLQRHRLRSTG